jgi:hypothetical protein
MPNEQQAGMMSPDIMPEAMAPDEVGVEQGFGEDEKAALSLAIEQFPIVGTILEKLMEAAAPPAESPEDTVKANLSPGEYVIPKDVVLDKGKGFFDKLLESATKSKEEGMPVRGNTEKAYAGGGYVTEDGIFESQKGFVEQMYEQGKETQKNLLHKESGFNYAEGGFVENILSLFGGSEDTDETPYSVEGITPEMRQADPELDFYLNELQGGAGKGRAINWLKQNYPQ